tara:strand:- start:9413 stop:10813 length:1401 start_codon:yes stop_codon:yes gene_type:complete
MAISLGSGTTTPAPVKQTLASNYVDFTATATAGWAQQYLPELYEAEVEKYGNRSVGGFLSMVGAEMPMSSDQVVWSEQGRLHLSYSGGTCAADSSGENTISGLTGHAIRVGQLVVISDGTDVAKAQVTAIPSTSSIKVKGYAGATGLVADSSIVTTSGAIKLFVFGSEFKKAQNGMSEAVTPSFQSYTNNPIIMKDKYEISGSDAAQIGWVEVSGESGQGGFLWYLKAEGDTRQRFNDYLEMTMVEIEKNSNTNLTGIKGSEGLFAAIKDRGHIHEDGLDGSSASDDLTDFDNMLKKLDKQGAIEENVMFLNRDLSLNFDDMLAGLNPHAAGGLDYGLFNNSEDMALNLGFNGFRRGSYDFYKTDWKYLNDASTRGEIASDVQGILVPAGTSSVYDQVLGKNIKRPFLHVRYRASEADDRKLKTWITGSVGGASTSDLDAMEVHYLSERCLVTQAANNFVIFGNFS